MNNEHNHDDAMEVHILIADSPEKLVEQMRAQGVPEAAITDIIGKLQGVKGQVDRSGIYERAIKDAIVTASGDNGGLDMPAILGALTQVMGGHIGITVPKAKWDEAIESIAKLLGVFAETTADAAADLKASVERGETTAVEFVKAAATERGGEIPAAVMKAAEEVDALVARKREDERETEKAATTAAVAITLHDAETPIIKRRTHTDDMLVALSRGQPVHAGDALHLRRKGYIDSDGMISPIGKARAQELGA